MGDKTYLLNKAGDAVIRINDSYHYFEMKTVRVEELRKAAEIKHTCPFCEAGFPRIRCRRVR